MGLNYITCTSIKKHEHFHSHLIFILQIHFVSINGYRCDKYLDLQKIKNTFQECLQHVHTVTHECLQLIFSTWIKQRPVINDIRGLKTQMTYQGILIYWILRQWMQNLYRYCTWLKYYFYFNWIFVETQFKEKEALKLSVYIRLDKVGTHHKPSLIQIIWWLSDTSFFLKLENKSLFHKQKSFSCVTTDF